MEQLFNFYLKFIEWFIKITSTGYRNSLVYKKQVDLLYSQIPLIVIAVILISSSVAALFYDNSNHLYTLLWLASVYIFSFVRIYYYIKRNRGTSSFSVKQWAQLGVSFSLFSGIQWSVTVLIFFNSDTTVDTSILIVILLAMISASVASASVIPAAFAGYAAPIAISLLFTLFNTQDSNYHAFANMIIIFIAASSIFSRNTYKSIMYGIRLSIENMDLIEQLQTEKEKAESANIAKSKFLASASHDLRQPLQSMTLFTEALKENLKDPENLNLANRITNSHDALRDLLNALLDISKLDAGGIEVKSISFDISQITNELYSEFQAEISQKNQQLAISKSSYIVFSDPMITKRILQNLIANASHHSPEETMIIVEMKPHNNFLSIKVKDNGLGIPTEEQNNIFNEFYQINNPERDRNKGLGLGLAIVKRLSLLLNSEIKLRSSDGAGCDFSFKLPLATQEQLIEKEKKTKTSKLISLDNVQVLLVEDEIDVREALAITLKRWGCKVWQTDNIAGALAFLNQQNIDFIITDYRLREHETGIDLLKAIYHVNADIPGIMITGDTGTEQIQAFLQTGHIVLHKPVKPAELRMAIQQSYKRLSN